MELGITWEDLKEVVRNEAYEDGFAEGKEAGHEVGRAKGREEGRAEGREEGRTDEKIRIAQNFKLSGIPISVIAENTGLTEEEVEKL